MPYSAHTRATTGATRRSEASVSWFEQAGDLELHRPGVADREAAVGDMVVSSAWMTESSSE
jgi:hypothetical protein